MTYANEAKLDTMRRNLKPLSITLMGLKDMKKMGYEIPEVEETGKSPLENAKVKAEAYYKAFQIPVFSCDTGLYFANIPEQYQPGIHVRRVGNKILTDEEMIEYYSGLAKKFGSLTARYQNAICFYKDESHIYESMDEKLSGKPFLLVETPRDNVRNVGFPLDSLSVQIETGFYYYDLDEKQIGAIDEVAMDEGFREFFKKYM